mmetsp:Transcript_34792/g.95972  ORF Transcript_34792/g.95972 Transcript_34792/m.95972 type:complete len:239 (+) Transcript_34792:1464-2180(+)
MRPHDVCCLCLCGLHSRAHSRESCKARNLRQHGVCKEPSRKHARNILHSSGENVTCETEHFLLRIERCLEDRHRWRRSCGGSAGALGSASAETQDEARRLLEHCGRCRWRGLERRECSIARQTADGLPLFAQSVGDRGDEEPAARLDGRSLHARAVDAHERQQSCARRCPHQLVRVNRQAGNAFEEGEVVVGTEEKSGTVAIEPERQALDEGDEPSCEFLVVLAKVAATKLAQLPATE